MRKKGHGSRGKGGGTKSHVSGPTGRRGNSGNTKTRGKGTSFKPHNARHT